tara:strand:- start:716 stop:1132 length:417 start_codon:yes stop_codon:yes gene_type:complete
MAEQPRFSKISTLINAIFGNTTPDQSVAGNEMSELDKIAETNNNKKIRKDTFKKLLAASQKATEEESNEMIKGAKVQLGGNPYDLSAVKIKPMESRNSPLFAGLNDIQSGNMKNLGENQGSLMKTLYGENLPRTVNRR